MSTYVDNAQNRRLGRVGMPLGSMPVSRSSSGSSGGGGGAGGARYSGSSSGRSSYGGSTKTYVDNAYNRSVGRVGMPHGTAVVSKSSSASQSSSGGRGGASYCGSSSGGSSYGGSSYGGSTKTYVDNAYNRKVGRVGMPHGTAVVSKSSSASQSSSGGRRGASYCGSSSRGSSYGGLTKTYVDNACNRSVGRVQSRPSSRTSTCSSGLKVYKDNEQVVDLANRFEQIRLWQEESRTDRQPKTSRDLLRKYSGEKIQYDELDLKKQIGHGGYGDVYFAKWKGTVVAVKKLRVQRVSKKRLQEFASEINIFCTLDHPNIVKFIGACCVTPNIAIVMEYMEGSLFDILHGADDTPTEEEKLDIIIQIARGLEYLHKKNIAHCDFKSDNVLISQNDESYEAKITDFGFSMMKSNSETSSTSCSEVKNHGTPHYSAPEVLRGDLLNRSSMMKADVYSLGLVVYEVISEEVPFDDLKARQLERYVGKRYKIPTFGYDVEETVENDVQECGNRDPSSRPSALSFLHSVETWEWLYTE